MRRKQKSVSTLLPKRLREYVAADWSGRDEAERYGEWMQARREWKDERGIIQLPDDEDASAAFPEGEFRPEDL